MTDSIREPVADKPIRMQVTPVKFTPIGGGTFPPPLSETIMTQTLESVLPPRELTSKIQEQIAGLGENAEMIAASLALEGIKGEKGEAQSCALAAYVDKHFGDQLVSVDVCSAVRIRYDGDCEEDTYDQFPLTPAAYDFIVAFDSGAFPGLVE